MKHEYCSIFFLERKILIRLFSPFKLNIFEIIKIINLLNQNPKPIINIDFIENKKIIIKNENLKLK